MNNLMKAKLVYHLEDQIGVESGLALSIVENFFAEIINALENNEKVKLVGLGEFLVKEKAERPGRNPKTGEEVKITQRRVVMFRTSPTLRKKLNRLSLADDIDE